MLFLEIYIGLCIVFFPVVLWRLKKAPTGWQDENGFHLKKPEEKLIKFPLKKKAG